MSLTTQKTKSKSMLQEKEKKVYLSEIIAKPYVDLLSNKKTRHQIVYGGRGSGKSSFHEIKIPYLFLQDKHAEAVVIRKDYKSHRSTTFAGLKIGFERLGWHLKAGKNYPRGTTGVIYMQTDQGNYVHFEGMNNFEATKGARPMFVGNKIKILWMMEITEFNDETEMNQMISNYIRGQKDYFVILYEFNPHPNPAHWTYAWLDKMSKRNDTVVRKTTYLDLPERQRQAFLGHEMLSEIEMLKEIDYEQYKNIYLGEPANIVGNIYRKFVYDNHVLDLSEEIDYNSISIGVDYGETDATVFTAIGYTEGKKEMHVLKTYYHKNNGNDSKAIDDYLEDLFDFLASLWLKYGRYMTVYVDSAAKHFWSFLKKEKVRRRAGYFKVEETNKTRKTNRYSSAIEERIGITNLMLASNYLKIDKSCHELVEAILFSARDKNGNRKDDSMTNIDSLDSLEYAWLHDITKIENAILRNKGYENEEDSNAS